MSERPIDVVVNGQTANLRIMHPRDEPAVLAFARRLAPHELLFLPRDIREPKVVAAWAREIEAGRLKTLLAWSGGTVIGCGTLVRDRLSWSPHVAEIRVVIGEAMRGGGLGTALVQEVFRLALADGAEKVFAQMTTDQQGAIAIFEGLGFRPEAILRQHVRDETGTARDLLVLSHIVAEVAATLEAYGVFEATTDD